jgi:hypothetical protein
MMERESDAVLSERFDDCPGATFRFDTRDASSWVDFDEPDQKSPERTPDLLRTLLRQTMDVWWQDYASDRAAEFLANEAESDRLTREEHAFEENR